MKSELNQIKDGINEILNNLPLYFDSQLEAEMLASQLKPLLELEPDIPVEIQSTEEWFEENLDGLPEVIQIDKLKSICFRQQDILVNANIELKLIKERIAKTDDLINQLATKHGIA